MKKHVNNDYYISSFGGSGPGDKYDYIKISYRVNHYLPLRLARKKLLDIQESYVHEINNNKSLLEDFTVSQVERSNIHISLIIGHQLKPGPWEICTAAAHSRVITYRTETTIDGNWDFYEVGKEIYDEALKVAYGCGPFKKVITSTKLGYKGIPLELHGPWGFFIEKAVIPQIQSGEFIYYAQVNGEEWKLAVCGDQVVVEATGQSIREFFPPAPED